MKKNILMTAAIALATGLAACAPAAEEAEAPEATEVVEEATEAEAPEEEAAMTGEEVAATEGEGEGDGSLDPEGNPVDQ